MALPIYYYMTDISVVFQEVTVELHHVQYCMDHNSIRGVSNPQPVGHMWPSLAMKVAQHKIVNLLNTL